MQVVTVLSFPTTVSGVNEFKRSYGRGIATALNISSNYVTVTSATVSNRRVLLAVGTTVTVAYVIAVPQGAMSTAALITSLQTVQSSGHLDRSLAASGIPGALAAAPTVIDISPTSAPTPSPTTAPIPNPTSSSGGLSRRNGAIIGGCVGGFFGLILIGFLATFYRKKLRTSVYISNDSNIYRYEEEDGPTATV